MRARVGHIGSALSIAEIAAVSSGKRCGCRAPTTPPGTGSYSRKARELALYAALHLEDILSARSCTRKRAKRWRPAS